MAATIIPFDVNINFSVLQKLNNEGLISLSARELQQAAKVANCFKITYDPKELDILINGMDI